MIMFYPKNNQELILKNSSPTFRMSKWENPKSKKWKMMKIDIVLKFDVKVVAHSEAVQNTSTTSKLSILDHITSLKSELPPKNSYWKTAFLRFSVILRVTISYFRKVPKKNSYLKVLPVNSWDHGDAFCTISRYFLMIRSKVMWCWKSIIFSKNYSIIAYWLWFLKLLNFQHHITFDLIIKKYRDIVQKASPWSQKVIGRTFRHEFFLGTFLK